MPRIHVRTNRFINRDKKFDMVEQIKKVIDTIPWEDGQHLLADFDGECAMLFGEDPTQPCATVELNILEKVYLRVDPEVLEKALLIITNIVCSSCAVPVERIFAYINPIPMWAWGGINIEKTIINFDDEKEEGDGQMFKGNIKHQRCGML